MSLPNDLKNFRASDSDPFQLISPDAAVLIFAVLVICSYMLFGGGVE